MNPRYLRHRLERGAKLLWWTQRHMPNVACRFADDKGDMGMVIIDTSKGDVYPEQIRKLGTDLQGRGWTFTRSVNAWVGVTTYEGHREDQPTVLIEVPSPVNRSADAPEMVRQQWDWKEAQLGW